jgi:predicted phage-related endonuclease
MAQTEDIPYEVSDFATSEDDNKAADPDQPNKSILKDIQKYLKEAIAEHSSVDMIDLTEKAKMTPTQQIAVHKLVKNHLENIKSSIDNKIKELA